MPTLHAGTELDDHLSGIADKNGLLTVAGFGSLLSEKSARSTFPELQNFRQGRVRGFRRIFAHTASIFFVRKIARPETGEISSLSCEECEGEEIVVTLFEIQSTPESREAYVEREHEFRFLAVQCEDFSGNPCPTLAVLCAAWNDESYREARCSDVEFQQRYGRFGIEKVWRDDVLPCRAYLRHCILASENLGEEAHASFMDHTYLADRKTTIRKYMESHGYIMEESLPPELAARYGG